MNIGKTWSIGPFSKPLGGTEKSSVDRDSGFSFSLKCAIITWSGFCLDLRLTAAFPFYRFHAIAVFQLAFGTPTHEHFVFASDARRFGSINPWRRHDFIRWIHRHGCYIAASICIIVAWWCCIQCFRQPVEGFHGLLFYAVHQFCLHLCHANFVRYLWILQDHNRQRIRQGFIQVAVQQLPVACVTLSSDSCFFVVQGKQAARSKELTSPMVARNSARCLRFILERIDFPMTNASVPHCAGTF